MTAAGVDAAVLVQAFGAYTYDNSYTIDAAAASPDRFVSIAIVDAEDPASPATVSALAHETGVHRRAAVLDRRAGAPAADVARPSRSRSSCGRSAPTLGLRVVVACFPEHLSRLQRVLAQFPEQPVVLDHCGFVALDGGPPYPQAARAVRARRAHQPAPQDHVARAGERRSSARGRRRHRRPPRRRVRRATGWSGAPTTRRPTTARTPISSRSPSTRAATSRSRDRGAGAGRHRARALARAGTR